METPPALRERAFHALSPNVAEGTHFLGLGQPARPVRTCLKSADPSAQMCTSARGTFENWTSGSSTEEPAEEWWRPRSSRSGGRPPRSSSLRELLVCCYHKGSHRSNHAKNPRPMLGNCNNRRQLMKEIRMSTVESWPKPEPTEAVQLQRQPGGS